mmetsp:Transcript_55013/g.164761  ORF Transcript_55013/g.164761 Transcript_55013/m.164761 type:complete len:162 (+) Transcript_55013:2286-2771(+)
MVEAEGGENDLAIGEPHSSGGTTGEAGARGRDPRLLDLLLDDGGSGALSRDAARLLATFSPAAVVVVFLDALASFSESSLSPEKAAPSFSASPGSSDEKVLLSSKSGEKATCLSMALSCVLSGDKDDNPLLFLLPADKPAPESGGGGDFGLPLVSPLALPL